MSVVSPYLPVPIDSTSGHPLPLWDSPSTLPGSAEREPSYLVVSRILISSFHTQKPQNNLRVNGKGVREVEDPLCGWVKGGIVFVVYQRMWVVNFILAFIPCHSNTDEREIKKIPDMDEKDGKVGW